MFNTVPRWRVSSHIIFTLLLQSMPIIMLNMYFLNIMPKMQALIHLLQLLMPINMPWSILCCHWLTIQHYWMQTVFFSMLAVLYQSNLLFKMCPRAFLVPKLLSNKLPFRLVQYQWLMCPVHHQLYCLPELNRSLSTMSKQFLPLSRQLLFKLSCCWLCQKHQFRKMWSLPNHL